MKWDAVMIPYSYYNSGDFYSMFLTPQTPAFFAKEPLIPLSWFYRAGRENRTQKGKKISFVHCHAVSQQQSEGGTQLYDHQTLLPLCVC